jgi:hypothetical protein
MPVGVWTAPKAFKTVFRGTEWIGVGGWFGALGGALRAPGVGAAPAGKSRRGWWVVLDWKFLSLERFHAG